MIAHRYAEAAALVPMLHVKPGPTTVLVAGPLAALLAAEALRWRDTTSVLVHGSSQIPIKDSRLSYPTTLEPASVDVVLLSPDMAPSEYAPALKRGGVLQASTYQQEKVASLRASMKTLTGAAVPYREYLPEPLWLVIGAAGSSPRRVRRPPDGARRITERYLPALFSFGKDEIAVVFGPGEKS